MTWRTTAAIPWSSRPTKRDSMRSSNSPRSATKKGGTERARGRVPCLNRTFCFFCVWVLGLLLSSRVCAQHIDTRVLTPGQPMQLTINPNVATTLLFPDAIGGAFGLGLVSAGAHENQAALQGIVALEHPEGSPLMVLHALAPG